MFNSIEKRFDIRFSTEKPFNILSVKNGGSDVLQNASLLINCVFYAHLTHYLCFDTLTFHI